MAGPVDFIGRIMRRGRKPQQPARETEAYPHLAQLGSPRESKKRASFKPVARNLRYFSRTPYARRAINAIKGPISQLEWEILPVKGVKSNAELERQIETVTYCLEHPNADDSFRSLVEQVVEDTLCGAGAIEIQVGADETRPLWLWPVDGLSIQMFAGWDGTDPRAARYYQTSGYGGIGNLPNDGIPLRNDELIYLKPNPSTADPFGCGPVEIAFLSIARQLGVADFAGKLASNARPSSLLWVKNVGDNYLSSFRAYWRNQIEGQGEMPIIGGEEAEAMRLWPDGDKALYLEWQQFLIREIATSFDLSPQNLGIEADVNRNTSEVAEDRDWDAAIKPMAHLVQSHLTREAIHAKLGYYNLRMRFIGLDREDEMQTAKIYETYYKNNMITPNEQRDVMGKPPADNVWGDRTFADAQVAVEAARSMATNLDADLPDLGGTKPAATKKPARAKE
jgi:phage portal protein BeeE